MRRLILTGSLLLALLASGALSAVAASADPGNRQAHHARVVTYPGHGVTVHRASGQIGRLDATSVAFRQFVLKKLDDLWGWTHRDQRCTRAPIVTVKRWRSDGWALISNMGVFGPPACARGANESIWSRQGGSWHMELGTQDGYRCAVLRNHRVPADMSARCYDQQGRDVPYDGPR